MDTGSFRERITEAIRYWELRRLIYNAILFLILAVYFTMNYPASKNALSVDEVLMFFLLAVLANVAYCAAYLPDVFAQASGFREQWQKYRWLVFIIGATFAGVITRFFAVGIFNSPR
jgi:drug/metabolite transporter (DMT)-like permease